MDQESRALKYAEKKLAELEENEVGLVEEIEKLEKSLTKAQHDQVSFAQFLNLSKNASTKVQHGGDQSKKT
jgi:hypothetical protein